MLKKLKFNYNLKYGDVFIGVAILAVIVFALIFKSFVYKNEFENSMERLEQVVEQQTTVINEIFDDIENYIIMTSEFISRDNNINEICENLNIYAKRQDFKEIAFVDTTGIGVNNNGTVVDLTEKDYFLKSLNGDICIDTEKNSDKYCDVDVIISVPVIDQSENIKGVLAARFQLYYINFFKDINITNEDVKITISNGNRDIIYDSEKFDINMAGRFENKIDYDIKYIEPSNGDIVIDNLNSQKSGILEYKLGGERKFAYYMPLGINTWNIFVIVPETYITNQMEIINYAVIKLIVCTILSALLLFALIIYIINNTNKKIMNTNRELKISEETFRISAEHGQKTIFDYYPDENIINVIVSNCFYGMPKLLYDVPESFFTKNIIDKNYRDTVIEAFNKIKLKEKRVSFSVKCNDCNNKSIWANFDIMNVFDENGNVIKSIGVIEDVTEKKNAEEMYIKEKNLKEAMTGDNMIIVEVDMNTGEFKIDATMNVEINSLKLLHNSFESFCDTIYNKYIFEEDIKIAKYIVESDNELRNIELRARFVKNGVEDYRWISVIKNIIKNPVYGINKSFFYVKDIDKAKRQAILLKYNAEIDILTGIFNRATVEKKITEYMSEEHKSAVVMIIDVDKFKFVNDTYGHSVGDEILKISASRIKNEFRKNDIVGRLGGDEFIVLIDGIKDMSVVSRKAENLSSPYVYKVDDIEIELTLSIGIAKFPYDGNGYNEIYKKADEALYLSKNGGRGKYNFYREM